MMNYPGLVCHDCATEAGGRLQDDSPPTWHIGWCNVCGIKKAVTEPRDYGYPKFVTQVCVHGSCPHRDNKSDSGCDAYSAIRICPESRQED